jgi:uncharacterized membrane protein YkvI
MINWLIIAIAIVLVIFILKFKNIKHKVVLILILLLIIFIYTTSSALFANQSIDFKTLSGMEKAAGIYWSWLSNAFGNAGILAGNAAKMNWNLTNSSAQQINKAPVK